MRFYSFTNSLYMSPLQVGLQTAHCVAEAAINAHKSKNSGMFGAWARDHKTIVILNGGNCASLLKIEDFFKKGQNPYVWASFYEDVASLNGAITAVGVVLPEEIYETALLVRNRTLFRPPGGDQYSSFMFEGVGDLDENLRLGRLCRFYNEADEWTISLVELLNTCKLA